MEEREEMKFISWNVNGIRACVQKGFMDFFKEADADIFCLQETKMQEGQLVLDLPEYHQYWNSAVKKGYSGTAIFTKKEPLSVTYGLGIEEHDQEGRVITLEFEDFYFITVYTPNSQSELARLDYRMAWEDAFLAYLKKLEETKPVIFCGDLNVAHKEIDLKNPKTNRKNAGFTDEERAKFSALLDAGFIDTYRYFYPDKEGIYSWWSYRFKAREKNAGWRIDYFCTSKALESRLEILNEEFSLQHDRNPIESMKSRLKSPSSIMNKMQKRGLSLDFPTMQANIMDIAGVRVICSFEEDVFFLAKCLKDQSDIEIITEKDYISHPKPNGYRSLHLTIRLPVFFAEKEIHVPVEIQLRTIAMDFWASLEHTIRYKKNLPINAEVETELKECADSSREWDRKMEHLLHILT